MGRFTPERKAVLDAIKEEIRKQKLLPMMFDFIPSTSQTILETVSTLAHMARFVIADLTDAKSILQELQAIVPNNPSVPVQPPLLASQEEPGMFDFIQRFPWVLETYRYQGYVRDTCKNQSQRYDGVAANSGLGCNGSGGVSISRMYCPNRLMCSVRYGLKRLTTSGVTYSPSCRSS